MFSKTVMCGQIAYDWKTMPRFRRFGARNTRRGTEATMRPRSVISPASGRSSPATRRSVVVLPQPLGPSRVKTSPRRTSRDARSTAGWGPKALLTSSSAKTVSIGLDLLDDGAGDVLRLHDLGQVVFGVDLEEFGVGRHRVLRVARLDSDAPCVRLDLLGPDDLRVPGEKPVDEDLGRGRMRRTIDEPERAAARAHRGHFGEVEELEILGEPLPLEGGEELRVDAEGDGIAAAHHELRNLAVVAAQHRLLVDEELLDDVVAQVEARGGHRPEGIAHHADVGQEQLALPARVEQILEPAVLVFLDQVGVDGDAATPHRDEAVAERAVLDQREAALEAALPAVFHLRQHDGGTHG